MFPWDPTQKCFQRVSHCPSLMWLMVCHRGDDTSDRAIRTRNGINRKLISLYSLAGHWLELKWIRGWEQLKYLIQPIPSTRCTIAMYTKCKCSQWFWQYCFLKTASIMLNQGWMDWWSFGIHRGVDCSIEGRCTMYIKGKWLSPNLSFSRFNPCTICCLIASSYVTWRNYI